MNQDAAEILRAVKRNEKRDPVALHLAPRMLKSQEMKWVNEYSVSFDRKRAEAVSGRCNSKNMLCRPEVQLALEARVAEHEERTELTADYVRDYIHSILELNPTDYFQLDESGDWVVDPRQFDGLPDRVKRLVEGVEAKVSRGQLVFKVVFLSKTAALAMAAKYTLTQHFDAKVALPWDKVLDHIERGGHDSVERRLTEYEHANDARGSGGPGTAPTGGNGATS